MPAHSKPSSQLQKFVISSKKRERPERRLGMKFCLWGISGTPQIYKSSVGQSASRLAIGKGEPFVDAQSWQLVILPNHPLSKCKTLHPKSIAQKMTQTLTYSIYLLFHHKILFFARVRFSIFLACLQKLISPTILKILKNKLRMLE